MNNSTTDLKAGGKNVPISSITVRTLTLAAPGRDHALDVRISAPLTGNKLPVVLFAHGFGSSMYGYDPLAEFWAARGFAVIQPTFLDSRTLLGNPKATHQDAINAYLTNPRSAYIWRQRVIDLKLILDQLHTIERSVPQLQGRLDHNRIAAAGHSFGAHTAGLLLGARMIGPDGKLGQDMFDQRIKAGILLSAGGRGGDALSEFAKVNFNYLNQSYAGLTTPTLVVAGDQDYSPLTTSGPEWFTDAYTQSPGANALLTLFGGEHMLGGITGYHAEETTDENPARVAIVQRLTWAYLQSAFSPDDPAWPIACLALTEDPEQLAEIKIK